MLRFTVLAALSFFALLVAVDTPAAAQADSKYRSVPGPCAVESACLQHEWFDVTVSFYDPNEGVWKSAGFAEVDVGHEATLIYFFSRTNVEMLVKVLDAKAVNQRFWVFAAAATDLGFRLKVRDTHTGWTNEYHNPIGTRPLAITDTEAFIHDDRTPGSDPPDGVGTWRGLTVSDEDRCSEYRASDYRYSQSVEQDIVNRLGGIFSPYTCETFDSTSRTDIEHIIARSEAHDSGLCSASASTRRRFAEDVLNLTLASPSLNRNEKGAKDAAEWMPEQNRCWFAQTIVDVRRAYNLTIDQAEVDALERVLSSCSSTSIRCDGATPSPDPAHPPVRTFSNCTELRNAGWTKGVNRNGGTYQYRSWDDPERRTYSMNTARDRDNDGHACE